MLDFSEHRIGVIVPAYRVAPHIVQVIRGVPDFVESIIVVDDASPDETADLVASLEDPRVTLLHHDVNQGLGAAMRTGFTEALRQRLDIVVKMDGDDQMDPAHLPRLLTPLILGRADMTKGNRFHDLRALRKMPAVRMVGNAALTFLVKLASGYWDMFDPTNGYFAIRTEVLDRLNLNKLPERFFFESGFLVSLGIAGAVVRDVPIGARYGSEESSLSIWKTLVEFPPRLCWGLLRRLFWRYFVFDFTAVSVFLLIGLPSLAWGIWWGLSAMWELKGTGQPASAGTVMLAAMPIILGFMLVLQAMVVDIGSVPRQPLSSIGSTPVTHDEDAETGGDGADDGE
ncbi:MAG: glycosyltransferase family 2 protein [bacterium]|nr:glycosyltransferase family 2 protein [bacterium]